MRSNHLDALLDDSAIFPQPSPELRLAAHFAEGAGSCAHHLFARAHIFTLDPPIECRADVDAQRAQVDPVRKPRGLFDACALEGVHGEGCCIRASEGLLKGVATCGITSVFGIET